MPKVKITTLGCRVNQYESNEIAKQLFHLGFEITSDDKCDITIINTCTVTAMSDQKSRKFFHCAERNSEYVIVTGCSVNINSDFYYGKNTIVVRNEDKNTIPDICFGLYKDILPAKKSAESSYSGPLKMNNVRNYLKIEDGCNYKCSYCIINKARGPVKSKPLDQIVNEAYKIAESGCKEIILTGVETASYGNDLNNKTGLVDVISAIENVDGIERIGLSSMQPEFFTKDNCLKLASIKKFLPHFHISIQSASNNTLKKMHRIYNSEELQTYINNINSIIPETMLTADVITGFPGETEKDFNDTLFFFQKNRFLHLHIFPYSIRPGTIAATLPDQIPSAKKKERLKILNDQQTAVTTDVLKKYISKHISDPVSVLIESFDGSYYIGHSEHFVIVKTKTTEPVIGKICNITLTEQFESTCIGKISKIY